jgi:intein/homing endonuclease
MPYIYIDSVEKLDMAHDGYVALDEFWIYVDSRSSASSKNRITSSILLRSRKRELVYTFTTQMLDLLDKRVRKILDFTAYTLLNQNESVGKTLIFRGGYPKEGMILKTMRFYAHGVFQLYNSITGDQDIFYMNDNDLHIEKAEEFIPELHKEVFVPCLNIKNYKMEIKPAKAFLKHKVQKDGFEIKTDYGRRVKVTGDHSLLSWNDGKIENIPARNLKVGNYLCIPKNIPIIEKDVNEIDIAKRIHKKMDSLKIKCDFSLLVKVDDKFFRNNYDKIKKAMKEKYGNYAFVRLDLCKRNNYIPYHILEKIDKFPKKMYITSRYIKNLIPNKIKVDKDLMWLLGFFVAEGSTSKNHDLRFSSEDVYLKKVEKLMKRIFGIKMCYVKKTYGRSPATTCSIRSVSLLFDKLTEDLSWIIQLPKNKLKYFLKGWFDGDGYHNGNPDIFLITTANDKLVNPLLTILHRFNLLPSTHSYQAMTTIRGYKYKSYRNVITVAGIKKRQIKNILNWDKGIEQKIRAKTIGDIAIVKIRKIKPIFIDDYVYDFSVKDNENFIAGNLICCKNTNQEINMIEDDGLPAKIIFQESPNHPPKYFDDWESADKFAEKYWSKNLELLSLLMAGQ